MSYLYYFLRKIAYAFSVLFGVVTLLFILFNCMSGDPAQMMLGQQENTEQLQHIRKKFGFDKPLTTQYAYYLNDLSPISFHSTMPDDFTFYNSAIYSGWVLFQIQKTAVVLKRPYLRISYHKNQKRVSEIIWETFPNTVLLAVVSIGFALCIGITLGVITAVIQGHFLDKFVQFFSILGMSLPSFFSAILTAWIFGFLWHNYTGLPMSGSLYEIDDFGRGKYIAWKNLILPAFVLGIRPLAVIIQLTRGSVLDVLHLDYVRTAKAKGISRFQILYKHVLKNALNPVVTAVSGWFASMLAGAVFVEYIFGWNGMGKEIVNALNFLDLPVIMGIIIVISGCFVILTILVDFLYRYLDPRVQIKG